MARLQYSFLLVVFFFCHQKPCLEILEGRPAELQEGQAVPLWSWQSEYVWRWRGGVARLSASCVPAALGPDCRTHLCDSST